jgi:hypothetical protein
MKLTREALKNIILESVGNGIAGIGNTGASLANVYPGAGYIRNFPKGMAPDNNNKEPMTTRPPYETGPVDNPTEEGEVYVTQGKNVYRLVFDNEDLTTGRVMPVGEFKFMIDANTKVINWLDDVPANVRFDTDLEKQIVDFSGREE